MLAPPPSQGNNNANQALNICFHIAAEDLLALLLPSLKSAFAGYLQHPDKNNNERVSFYLAKICSIAGITCKCSFVRLLE